MDDQLLARRLEVALELADTGVDIMRQNLRRADPDATPEVIERRLRDWIDHRPGAEQGDCPGRPRRPIEV